MPTRSGKGFSISSDPPSAKTTSSKKQPVQNTRATRASKRARAHSDTLSTAPDVPLERNKAPARKKQKSGLAGLRNAGRAETEDVIDLTLSEDGPDVQTATYGMTWDLPIQDGPEEVDNKRGARHAVKTKRIAPATPGKHPDALQQQKQEEREWMKDLMKQQHAQRQRSSSDARATQLPGPWNTTQSTEASKDRAIVTQKTATRGAGPARVMFTLAEAKLRLYSAVKQPATYLIPPYTLRTGECIPFPVTESYHLGAIGRYGKASTGFVAQKPDRNAADYIFDWGKHCGKRIDEVSRAYLAGIVESPRLKDFLYKHRGLREALELYMPQDPRIARALFPSHGNALSLQHGAQTVAALTGGYDQNAKRHVLSADMMEPVMMPDLDGSTDAKSHVQAEPYTFTFGRYYGQTFHQVPTSYLRSIEHDKALLEKQNGLREAFARCFPRGCFRYEVEKYRFDFGKHVAKRMHEVPEAYLADVATNMLQLGRGVILQHALRCRNQELGKSNDALEATLKTIYKKKSQAKM